MHSFSRKIGHILLNIRHYSLYTHGKIGLTLFLLFSLFNPMNELGKLEQICHAKSRTTACKDHRGIWWGKAGPGRRKRPDPVRSLVKGDTIFPPSCAGN
jgi:hypothetical protein